MILAFLKESSIIDKGFVLLDFYKISNKTFFMSNSFRFSPRSVFFIGQQIRIFTIFLSFYCFGQKIDAQEKLSYSFENTTLLQGIKEVSEKEKITVRFYEPWLKDISLQGSYTGYSYEELLNNILHPFGMFVTHYNDRIYIIINDSENGQIVSKIKSDGTKVKSIIAGKADPKITSATITGTITDHEDRTPIIGAVLQIKNLQKGTVTDGKGYYSITLPVGQHTLEVSSLGYYKESIQLILQSDDQIGLTLLTQSSNLDEVLITGKREAAAESAGQMSKEVIELKEVEYLPSLMGDRDVLKTIELLPGINSNGEGSNGFSVRGGNSGQNLIILENAPVYNPAHLFGFFSVFNPGIVESATVYKGALPVSYGGRVASVMDIRLLSDASKSWDGEISVGYLSSRMNISGPLSKKLSIITGAKISYTDRFFGKLKNLDIRDSKANYYDWNLKFIYSLSEKDQLSISTFASEDNYSIPGNESVNYGNQVASMNWKHTFNQNKYSNSTLAFSRYFSKILSADSLLSTSLFNSINNLTLKNNLTINQSSNHMINYGFESNFTFVNPGNLEYRTALEKNIDQFEKERALEFSIYGSDEIKISNQLTLNIGLRSSTYLQFGPGKVYEYAEGYSKSESSVTDSTDYSGFQVMKSYWGLEPRFFLEYRINKTTNLKFNYGRSRQNLHLVNNAISISPTNIWKLSDQYLKPEVADMIAVGIFKDLNKKQINLSSEVYYRHINNLPDYKNGSELLTNHNLETALLSGTGNSYGAEFQLSKTGGKISGWISYTYARAFNQIKSNLALDEVNQGHVYAASTDRPHNLSITGDLWISRILSLSFNWNYYSGRPISFPEAIYTQDGVEVAFFSKRNQYRIPDYSKLDLALNMKGTSLKKNKNWDLYWSFGIYNVTGRNNIYSVYFQNEYGRIKAKKLTIISSPIPSLTATAKF